MKVIRDWSSDPSRPLKYPIIPFITWRVGNRGGYLGAKSYVADSEVFKNLMNPEDVYEGIDAPCFSFRHFTSLTHK